MADIFISYRRGETDTWIAGRLADRLGESFDVFFDGNSDSIDLGSSFPQEINEALAECKVVFAVIGPDWLEPANLGRLKEEDDWVRRELRTALNQRAVRVVPLLVESDAPPDPSLLPRDLETLPQRHAYRLDRDRWETDCSDLERRLREWLTKGPGPMPVQPRPPIPPGLPFLCDRRDQEDAFVRLVQSAEAATGFIACVVHGHKWESHDELFERFRSEGVLDDLFHSLEEGAACHSVRLGREGMKTGVAEALKNALRADVFHRRTMPDNELAAVFKALARPLVVIVQLTWADCRDLGTGMVKQLVEAWRGLAVRGPDGSVERLPYPALLWINLTYEEPDYELPAEVLHSPLPKLSAVEEGHIREWVGLDKVKPHVAAKKRELINLASDARYCHAPGKVHMVHFAEAVSSLLSS